MCSVATIWAEIENARLENGFPSTTKIRAAGETSFARVWETEQISKRNEGPVKDRGKDAHQCDSLFGECMLWLCAPIPSTVKNMCSGWDRGRDEDDRWLKESPRFEKYFILAAVTHFYTLRLKTRCAHSHICTRPYTHTCCNASVKRKTEASGKVLLWEALTWFAGARCASHNFASAVALCWTASRCIRCGNWWLRS